MPAGKPDHRSGHAKEISRRTFIRLGATAGLLAGCRALQESPTLTGASPAGATPTLAPPASGTPSPAWTATPTATTQVTATPALTATSSAAATPAAAATTTVPPRATPTAAPTTATTTTATATPTPDLTLGRVAHVRHSGVWNGERLAPQEIPRMLDAALTALTHLDDADVAWASLFPPHQRVAIKVNTIGSSSFSTHLPLVTALTDRLEQVGVPAEQIVIFDRSTRELESAGYPVNADGPGIRCVGTDGRYSAGWTLMGDSVALSDLLLGCDALINVPLLKYHGMAGISFAMKNHYGTFDQPGRFHQPRLGRALAELNALEPIKNRTRLIVGDALNIISPNWHTAESGDAILMSFDPVAHDTVGLQLYNSSMLPEFEMSQTPTFARANPWLESGAELGLGIHNPAAIERLEVTLG